MCSNLFRFTVIRRLKRHFSFQCGVWEVSLNECLSKSDIVNLEAHKNVFPCTVHKVWMMLVF